MKSYIIGVLSCLLLLSCKQTKAKNDAAQNGAIQIGWSNGITSDFLFHQKWEYREGIYKNEFGQLSCDGLCPPETDKMKEKNGRIKKEFLKDFYQLVDTTHQFYSLQSVALVDQWAGSNFATAIQKNKDTVICRTEMNIATHCSLILTIVDDKCFPKIELNSIDNAVGQKIYSCKSGTIEIDKKDWKKGILKTKFDLKFNNTEKQEKALTWKGKIYTNIKTN